MDYLEIIRAIIGSLFVLILPGLAWTYVFYRKNEVSAVERVILSFGLSIALISAAVYFLNKLAGVKITLVNIVIIIAILILMPLVVVFLRYKKLPTQKI